MIPPAIDPVSFKVDVEFGHRIVQPFPHFEVDSKWLSEPDGLRPDITDKDLWCYGTGLGWEVGAGRPSLPKGTDAGEASPDPAVFNPRTLTVIDTPTG